MKSEHRGPRKYAWDMEVFEREAPIMEGGAGGGRRGEGDGKGKAKRRAAAGGQPSGMGTAAGTSSM